MQALAKDLEPFAAAIAAGVPSVMTAHVAYPALDPEGIPATRSAAIIDGLLRGRLGFRGVVVSDALIMEGLAQGSSDEDAAVQAVRAGVDALLYPKDAALIARTLDSAPASALSPARIGEAVRRLERMVELVPKSAAGAPTGWGLRRRTGAGRARPPSAP